VERKGEKYGVGKKKSSNKGKKEGGRVRIGIREEKC